MSESKKDQENRLHKRFLVNNALTEALKRAEALTLSLRVTEWEKATSRDFLPKEVKKDMAELKDAETKINKALIAYCKEWGIKPEALGDWDSNISKRLKEVTDGITRELGRMKAYQDKQKETKETIDHNTIRNDAKRDLISAIDIAITRNLKDKEPISWETLPASVYNGVKVEVRMDGLSSAKASIEKAFQVIRGIYGATAGQEKDSNIPKDQLQAYERAMQSLDREIRRIKEYSDRQNAINKLKEEYQKVLKSNVDGLEMHDPRKVENDLALQYYEKKLKNEFEFEFQYSKSKSGNLLPGDLRIIPKDILVELQLSDLMKTSIQKEHAAIKTGLIQYTNSKRDVQIQFLDTIKQSLMNARIPNEKKAQLLHDALQIVLRTLQHERGSVKQPGRLEKVVNAELASLGKIYGSLRKDGSVKELVDYLQANPPFPKKVAEKIDTVLEKHAQIPGQEATKVLFKRS